VDECVFCAATAPRFDPEHWVSKWISKAEVGKNQRIMNVAPGRDPWIAKIVELTVQHICEDCNNHWMSDMESQTRDIALPLIRGERTTLDLRQQTKLATWCFLKVITLELGRPEDEQRSYPPFVYEGFHEHMRPPAGCVIAIGLRERSDDGLFVWWRSGAGEVAVPGLGKRASYRTALTIGHLVIETLGVLSGRVNPILEDDDRLVRIFPVTGPVAWPPEAAYTRVVDNDLT
jgi:hypothetical protein